jgi:hypothetical protein
VRGGLVVVEFVVQPGYVRAAGLELPDQVVFLVDDPPALLEFEQNS